jgi:hypothetical protein
VVAAALDPVSQWPPQGRAFCGELVDSILDEVGGLGITLAEHDSDKAWLLLADMSPSVHSAKSMRPMR